MSRSIALAVVALLVAALLAGAAANASGDAEPRAYQLWFSDRPPRQGHVFAGVTLMLLRQSSVTLRPASVRFSCSRGVIRAPGRVRYAPVVTSRIGSANGEPGPVIAVWTCVWRLPVGTAGRRLTAGYTRSAIGVDPATGRETGRTVDGGALAWRIRR